MQDLQTSQTISVYLADDFYVSEGVAQGDGMSFADDLVMDDLYHLRENAQRRPLSLSVDAKSGQFHVSQDSALGQTGNEVFLDSCLTMMAAESGTQEVLILVEVEDGGVENVFILPLAPLREKTGYRLVGMDRHAATRRFAEVACVSFTKGTHITMASGMQVPIEDLRVGDKVLTRDDGPQEVRWVGQTTLRAVGDFAPVVIREGALHNSNDLVVSPDHRLFIYQRQDKLGTGRHEVLVKVRHLINGESVYQQDGGFVEYYQLLFDDHQIIYAEGIAAESLLIDPRTRTALPDDMSTDSAIHAHRDHLDYEVQETLLSHRDAVRLLKEASSS